METKFNSQVCTSLEQSKTLLALGLKKETADMCWMPFRTKVNGEALDYTEHCSLPHGKDIPAWSMHRLLELSPELVKQDIPYFTKDGNVELVNGDGIVTKAWGGESLYDALIDFFQWLIKEGYFNKEYLV